MTRFLTLLAVLLSAAPVLADAHDDAVRAAVEKGLRRIEAGAANYPNHRQCFSCHHQAMAMMSLTAAGKRGFTVKKELVPEVVAYSRDFFEQRVAKIAEGANPGGGNGTVSYGLVSFAAVDQPPDKITAALVEYLLRRQRADGAWVPTSQRPPSQGSLFTNVALAVRGLRHYTPADDADLRERIDRAAERAKDWLLKTKPTDTEDRAFRLRGLIEVAADKDAVEAARDVLLKGQRDDGSWAQLADMKGDAYATGIVLTALRQSGVDPTTPAYRKGVEYLLKTQTEGGAWVVTTRSRPVQQFFDNGDAGGKSQFISFAATGWAVLALLEACPAP